MNTLTRALVTAASAAALTLGLSTAAQADDYTRLNAAQLEQTVLRAQMPKTLGSWSQNYYFTIKDKASTQPTVCWNAKGDVSLPSAAILGGVGYEVNSGSGAVSIYQYASEAKAKAALASLKKLGETCADAPTIMTDGGDKVPGKAGGDFTDDSMSGYGSILYYDQDDVTIMTDLRTTQRGLAIVQTEVMRTFPKTMSTAQRDKIGARVVKANTAWHKQAVKAYESFGQGNSR